MGRRTVKSDHLTIADGNYNRVTMVISNVYDAQDMADFAIPQWHIDAVESIYGKRQSWLFAFVTALN